MEKYLENTNYMSTFGYKNANFMESKWNIIKTKRKNLKLTQEDIAKKIGISASQYNYFENGKRNLSFPKFESLLDELGLKMILTEFDFKEDDLINLNKLINR